ncbi:MAG: hypothetical protein ABW194_10100 [Novosphingobium sp.]
MIGALVLAQAVTTLAPPATAPVPATAWKCRLSDSAGVTTELSGLVPELPGGRDPNRSVFDRFDEGGAKRVVAITGEGGEWTRDYQLTHGGGDETLVLNLKLRKGSPGVAYLTRFGDTERKAREPYRYVSAGLCSADFSPGDAQ